jgi:thymidylate synthase ThyX
MTTDIFIIDDQTPEDVAMLQALYSRSPAGVMSHLDKLKTAGSGKFMSQYYVGYGHASIGDCGTTNIFVEQVSMFVAKAIQDNPLYSGQEASTRYLDFSKQEILSPYDHPAARAVQRKWLEIYNTTLDKLKAALQIARPFDVNEYKNETVWKNALNARAFDIARSLLPCGATTLLSWTTNLRQARDHCRRLKHHPLPEVRDVVTKIFDALKAKYPNSFRGDEMTAHDTRDDYAQKFSLANHVGAPDDLIKRYKITDSELNALQKGQMIARRDAIDIEGLTQFEHDTLYARPSGANFPWRLEAYGRYNCLFMMDFGSFRDVQRHRNGVCPVPLVTPRYGLNAWYLDQFRALLPPGDFADLESNVAAQLKAVADLSTMGVQTCPVLDQYYYPMGLQILGHVSYSVPQMAYVGELRSGKTVHGSLRPVAQNMLRILQTDFPGLPVYGDFDIDDWSAKRGEQTIAEKVA